MGTTIGGRNAASKSTNHMTAGPPAMSMIPPMTPATPTGAPAPFPYIGKASSGSSTASKVIIGGGEAITEDSMLDVMPSPGNSPSQPAPMHDLVTMMVNAKIVVG
jgi:hypothetical protein